MSARRVIWLVTLTVTAAAVVATAHGLYEVAVASGVTPPVAVTYPLMADGLALVAYAATRHLTSAGRRYAWTIVVVAACLSGLGQAAWLAGGVAAAPWWLRAGVGAWPALAAVVAAHLVYLTGQRRGMTREDMQAALDRQILEDRLAARPVTDRTPAIRTGDRENPAPGPVQVPAPAAVVPNTPDRVTKVRTRTGTKADRIRTLLAQDPDRSIADLAAAVGSPTRYVRKVLAVGRTSNGTGP